MTRRLSPAEMEVCVLMALGFSNREIAVARGTAFSTAKTQAHRVLLGTGRNRHRLVEVLHEIEVRDMRRATT